MSKVRSILIAVVALAAVLVATSTASAATITIPGGAITGTATQTLTLDPGGLNFRCDLRFTGTLQRQIIANPGTLTLIGQLATGTGGNCGSGNTLTLLNVSTWLVWAQIDLVGGSPVITVLIREAGFLVSLLFGAGCRALYSGSIATTLNAAGTQLTFNTSVPLATRLGGITCPSPGRLAGTIGLSPAQPVTIAL